MEKIPDFEIRIDHLDLTLFSAIDSQSTDDDRRSWLAVQRSIRCTAEGYSYLEIGSHLGGSIQQHVMDPRCTKVFSIDKRPLAQPDDRGETYPYPDNSTARMVINLSSIIPNAARKLTCFDMDAKDVNPAAISPRPHFCFIDGEHTKSSVLSDFSFCLQVAAENGAICFHDDGVIAAAVIDIIRMLDKRGIFFIPLKLGGSTFGIFLGECSAVNDPAIKAVALDGRRWLKERKTAMFWKVLVPSCARPTVARIVRLFVKRMGRRAR